MRDETLSYRYSPLKLVRLLALGIGLTAVSAALAFGVVPVRAGSFEQFAGVVGALFFGLCTGLILWRLLRNPGPVVTLTRRGFTDIRLAPEEIAWLDIRHLGRAQIGRQTMLVLDVEPAIEQSLSLTRAVRWSRTANARLGIAGLVTSMQGLNAGFDEVADECFARMRASRQRQAGQ